MGKPDNEPFFLFRQYMLFGIAPVYLTMAGIYDAMSGFSIYFGRLSFTFSLPFLVNQICT